MYKNPHPGKFIAFEGLDGSGQSTQVKLLENYLIGRGKRVCLTKEPTKDSDAGREILEVLAHSETTSPEHLQELFVQDRGEHLKNIIIPALETGEIVISDRYFLSSLAFGSIDCDLEWLKKIHEHFLLPDLTVFLKVHADVSLGRIESRGKPIELFEKKEKLEKVVVNYDKLMGMFEDCVAVDGEQSIEAVHAEIIKIVDKILS